MKRIAMIFPGQGSQSIGMLQDFPSEFPEILHTFQEASDILGYDTWQLIQENNDNNLNKTEITQPILLTASIALWRLWRQQQGLLPIALAGHSLGEYTALVCAEALTFKEALFLVQKRGEFMQKAVPLHQGAMAAIIGLTDEQITSICLDTAHHDIVAPANFNAPGQTVIAGNMPAVERAMQKAKTLGAKLVKLLDVSVPSHCALMHPAALQLQPFLEKTSWRIPNIPIIHNISATYYEDLFSIKEALYKQLFSPVRWVESMQKMVTDFSITHIIECGPGKVLTGLNKRIINIPTMSLGKLSDFKEGLLTCCSV